MPKSKKKKTRDFQKVKLKVGKTLPKGDNVTNLSFKTRQIQLTQRIKDDGRQDIITKKKLSIQDLLRQCGHHSSSARVNAISGLKEHWLDNSADLMLPATVHGYGEILIKLSTLFIDNEVIVRHSAINLFKLMLAKLSKNSEGRNPKNSLDGRLYTHIHAYLCCAMTHVHEDIKLDSLVLFDSLLDLFPHLVVQQTGDLLKNLVGFISSPAYLGTKGDFTTQRLSLNPDSKLPVMKFRAQVLLRMKRTFMAAIDDVTRFVEGYESTMKSKEYLVWSLYRDHHGTNTKQNTYLVTDPRNCNYRFQLLFGGGCHELDEYITKPSCLESFLKLSVPVLLQCWREAHISVTHSESDCLVSADSIEVMSLVVSVIQLMYVLCAFHPNKDFYDLPSSRYLVSPEKLIKSYQQDFEKLLISDFPYSAQIQTSLSKKRKKNMTNNLIDSGASQSSLVALNLAVCEIMTSFCVDKSFKPGFNYMKKMETYIVRSLQKVPSMEQSKILVRIIKNVFTNQHTIARFTKAYSAVLRMYLSCAVKTPQKRLFYRLLAFMTKNWDGWKRTNLNCNYPIVRYEYNSDISDVLDEFLQNLPDLLQDVVGLGSEKEWIIDILTFMRHGHVQNCSGTFQSSFNAKLTWILDPQKGVLSCDDEEVQKNLLSLFSLGTPLSQDHLRQVLFLIRRPTDKPVLHQRKSCSMVTHAITSIISCMRWNLQLTCQVEFNKMMPEKICQLTDYLKFMFSLQIGMTGEELETMYLVETLNENSDRWFSVDFTVQGDQWERHVQIASVVAMEITSFYIPANRSKGYRQCFKYFDNLEQFWTQTYMNRSRVHILSAYSLIQFFYHASFFHNDGKPGPEFYKLASYIVASVLTSINCQSDSDKSVPSEQMVEQLKSDVINCMRVDASLLLLVMKLLDERCKGASSVMEKEASKAAHYFLLLDEKIKLKLENAESGKMIACSVMEVPQLL